MSAQDYGLKQEVLIKEGWSPLILELAKKGMSSSDIKRLLRTRHGVKTNATTITAIVKAYTKSHGALEATNSPTAEIELAEMKREAIMAMNHFKDSYLEALTLPDMIPSKYGERVNEGKLKLLDFYEREIRAWWDRLAKFYVWPDAKNTSQEVHLHQHTNDIKFIIDQIKEKGTTDFEDVIRELGE